MDPGKLFVLQPEIAEGGAAWHYFGRWTALPGKRV